MSLLVSLTTALVLIIFLRDCLKYKITPNPTSKKIRLKIKELLPEDFTGDIYELGSGFGHMSFFFAKLYPSCCIYSFEKARIPYFIQKIWLKLKLKNQIKLKFDDLFLQDLSSAQIVFCYLYRSAMPEIAKRFEKEFKPGSWLISHTFALDHLRPDKVAYADDLYRTPIYFYQKKKFEL